MKARRFAGVVAIGAIAIGILVTAGCSNEQTSASSSTTTQSTGTQDVTTQDVATQGSTTQGSTTQDTTRVLPVTKNPIVNNSTKEGLKVTSVMVENNVDPLTKKDLADRLQITIKNTSAETLSDLELFYQMTDSTTQKTEGYYQKLTAFSLAPGQEGTVYFDNESGSGHYPENTYSLYRTSANEVVLSIEVSAAGYKAATAEAKKAVGTGENASQ